MKKYILGAGIGMTVFGSIAATTPLSVADSQTVNPLSPTTARYTTSVAAVYDVNQIDALVQSIQDKLDAYSSPDTCVIAASSTIAGLTKVRNHWQGIEDALIAAGITPTN